MDSFTPSNLHSLNDYLLNFNMLNLCKMCYVGDQDDTKNDFMLNIINTPKQILEEYPQIHLLVCELDPLHDDAFRFALVFAFDN
jgi:hypothetical protein